MKADAKSDVMLGMIPTTMMRRWLSPLTTAAWTKSFSRRARAWARMTRALQAQPVTIRTSAIVVEPVGR